MKKNFKGCYALFKPLLNRTILRMSIMLATILICISSFQLQAADTAKDVKVSVRFENTSFSEVISYVEAHSKYRFFYNNRTLSSANSVTISLSGVSIDKALIMLLREAGLSFRIHNEQVVLKTKRDGNSISEMFATPDLTSLFDKKTDASGRALIFTADYIISGKVTSETGDPLPGVNVIVKGTTTGTTTDSEGLYRLSLQDGSSPTLVFSFIGYTIKEVEVSGQTIIDISMQPDAVELEEVVVVGYGTSKQAKITGAISTVSGGELSDGTFANPISRLQGKASGVTVINSHMPGGDPTVTIRGLSTINNTTPLYVIDGVPTKGGLSMINSNEIESISVLKDAASAAIYGARGANGVIIITTKRGASGKAKVSFTTRHGVSSFKNPFDMLNTKEFGEMLWLEAKNEGRAPNSVLYGNGATPIIPDYIVPSGRMEGDPLVDPSLYNYTSDGFYNITKANKSGTDWYSAIIADAPISEYNLAISGGGEKSVYALNLGYLTEDGITKYTSYDRYSIRTNADFQVNNWLKIGESLGLSFSKGQGNRDDGHEWSPIGYANAMWAIIPERDIMGNWAGSKGTGALGINPLAELYRQKNNSAKNLRGIGNAFAEAQIIKGLTFKSLFGFDYSTSNGRYLNLRNPEDQEARGSDQLYIDSGEGIQWNWANTLNFVKGFGSHTVNVLVGTEAISNTWSGFGASRTTFYSSDNNYMQLDAGEADINNYGNTSVGKTASYFGRVTYDFLSKYLLEVTVRRDGSSKFGRNSRWGTFPAVSAGWRISEEKFMDGIGFINNLKIRGGYGVSGNDEIGNYNGFSTFSADISRSYYPIDGNPNASQAGFYASRFGNPDAKWETTSTLNLGIDIGVLKNSLTASLDVWKRETRDMLFQKSIPSVVGFADPPAVNIGSMDNVGFDFEMNYTNKAMRGDLTYNLGVVLSRYRNEIVAISDTEAEFIEGEYFRYVTYTRATMGTAYPEFYGLIVDGFFEDAADAAAYPATYGTYNAPGHFKFRDVNDDGVINDEDRSFIGSPHPKFTAGFNAELAYKAFNLSAFFYSSYGNKIASYTKRWIDYGIFDSNRTTDRLYKSWGSPYLADNADATLPLADGSPISQYPSTAFLQDGSFLRLKTIQLSYTLPKSISQKLMMENLQVYIQGSNLFTLTKYKGWDPEIITQGASKGVDAAQWPTAKQVMMGLRLDF
jgi:TonB-dependent starch-binding outer membrane protein SusC